MKIPAVFALATIALLVVGAGCTDSRTTNENKLSVATTIVPLTSLAQNLLGGVADVQSVLPPSTEPHDVTLSTGELQTLQGAEVILTWGLTMDDWVGRGISATESKAPVLVATKYLNLPPGLNDPHAWLSPKRMLQISVGLSADLAKEFPTESERILKNAEVYRAKLEQLDSQYNELRNLPHRDIVTLHDAFEYLAGDYNLNIVATVRDLPEDNPSPEDIARVIKTLKKYPQAALFGESEIEPAVLQTIARDSGRIVYTLDPLEVADSHADTYIAVMEKNLQSLKQALGSAR